MKRRRVSRVYGDARAWTAETVAATGDRADSCQTTFTHVFEVDRSMDNGAALRRDWVSRDRDGTR